MYDTHHIHCIECVWYCPKEYEAGSKRIIHFFGGSDTSFDSYCGVNFQCTRILRQGKIIETSKNIETQVIHDLWKTIQQQGCYYHLPSGKLT
jgi:hypothetical protein